MNKMDVVYLVSPYRGTSNNVLTAWIQRQINIYNARKAAKALWKKGYYVFSPTINTANFDGITSDAQFLNFGLEMIKRCDTVVILNTDEKKLECSSGCIGEIEFAGLLGKKIILYSQIK